MKVFHTSIDKTFQEKKICTHGFDNLYFLWPKTLFTQAHEAKMQRLIFE